MVPLSSGALNEIMDGNDVENPVLQYMGNKKIVQNNTDRYRLLLNDGVTVNSFSILSPQLNHLITDKVLIECSIIRIKRMNSSVINNSGQGKRRVMLILDLDILVPGNEVNGQIGNAKPNSSAPSAESSSAPTPAPTSSSNFNRPPARLNSSLSNSDSIHVTPIAALTPYQNKWVIKARVMNKGDKRSWNNARGEGTLFSMDLIDESGEIRCTAFKNQCEKYYDLIEAGKVYYISRAQLKPANKQFSTLKNDYEMTLGNDSEIIPCNEESKEIPTGMALNITPINEIENKQSKDLIDVLGIVKSVGEIQQFTARTTGRELKKRDVFIMDQSRSMVVLTLWGQQAENFNGDNNPVIAIKNARIGEFQGGKNITTISSSIMQVDPDSPEAHTLRGWYSSVGNKEEVVNISKTVGGGGAGATGPMLSLQEAKDLGYGHNADLSVYCTKAIISFIKSENCMYKACPTDGCNKKVIDQSNEMYRCEKCDREYPNFKHRLLVFMSIADWSSNQWVTAFNEESENILGASAQELGEMKENDNNMFLERISQAAMEPFMFKVKVKVENFSDEMKLRTTVLSASKVNFRTYNAHLLEKIREHAQIGRA